jgi:hypothetical protein
MSRLPERTRNGLRANRIAVFGPQQAGGLPNCWKLLRVLTFDDHWALDGFDLRTVAGV